MSKGEPAQHGAMDHGRMGCLCFAGCASVMILVWLGQMQWAAESRLSEMFRSHWLMFQFYRGLYTGIPLVGILGFLSGLALYQGGIQNAVETVIPVMKGRWQIPWWTGFVVVSFCIYPLLPLLMVVLIQGAIRDRVLRQDEETWTANDKWVRAAHVACGCLGYAVLGLVGGYIVFESWIFSSRTPMAYEIIANLACVFVSSLGMGDCLLVLFVSRWRRLGRVGPPLKKVQFSLSALMSVLLALGLWASGLVLFFRND